ncbi:PIN domain-containing protein [Candidatus Roizmanbacteria bacterium]|nr:PIN domain-containing protein [Candidatus Roizmanbacteria bacterium]
MTTLYLDANIFFYLAEKSSLFYKSCSEFLRYCKKHSISIITSAETVQEILHYSKQTKQLGRGIRIIRSSLKLINYLCPVDKEIIEEYLNLASKYVTLDSRDLIHLATGIKNQDVVDYIITYDKKLHTVKDMKSIAPETFLRLTHDI